MVYVICWVVLKRYVISQLLLLCSSKEVTKKRRRNPRLPTATPCALAGRGTPALFGAFGRVRCSVRHRFRSALTQEVEVLLPYCFPLLIRHWLPRRCDDVNEAVARRPVTAVARRECLVVGRVEAAWVSVLDRQSEQPHL
jgi:hypothetical protein